MKLRMPAEWSKHSATWLAWPANRRTWPGRKLAAVKSVFIQMMTALLPGERVNVLVCDKNEAVEVIRALALGGVETRNLALHKVNTADAWIRDYGPTFVEVRGKRKEGRGKAVVKWKFNAWGGKYPELKRDDGVVGRIGALKKYRTLHPGIVLEGGSVDVNGRGLCLTTEECLLNKNRNPRLSRQNIEAALRRFLGVKRVVWLKKGIGHGDDTDGHVDDIARFVGPSTVLALKGDRENIARLKAAGLKVIELPLTAVRGKRLPASYANFYIGNAAVLVPVYGHPNDKKALRILKRFFPGRKIAGINCAALVHGLGSIHCVTQQEPA